LDVSLFSSWDAPPSVQHVPSGFPWRVPSTRFACQAVYPIWFFFSPIHPHAGMDCLARSVRGRHRTLWLCHSPTVHTRTPTLQFVVLRRFSGMNPLGILLPCFRFGLSLFCPLRCFTPLTLHRVPRSLGFSPGSILLFLTLVGDPVANVVLIDGPSPPFRLFSGPLTSSRINPQRRVSLFVFPFPPNLRTHSRNPHRCSKWLRFCWYWSFLHLTIPPHSTRTFFVLSPFQDTLDAVFTPRKGEKVAFEVLNPGVGAECRGGLVFNLER